MDILIPLIYTVIPFIFSYAYYVVVFFFHFEDIDPLVSFFSNILFREFALISMWRVPKMPIGAHMILSFLAEPLKQPTETLLSFEDHVVSENLQEFQDWVCFTSSSPIVLNPQ